MTKVMQWLYWKTVLTSKLDSHSMPLTRIYVINVIDSSYSIRYFQEKKLD